MTTVAGPVTVVTVATVFDKLSKILGDVADGITSKVQAKVLLTELAGRCKEQKIPFIVPDELLDTLSKAQPNPYLTKDELDNDYSEEESSEYEED